MALKDYYTILDLPPGSSPGEVKKAYRQLVMQYHPDRNQGNPYAAAHFQEIREAYEVLSDPEKREEYHLQRGYWKSIGKAFAESGPVTPQRVLLQARQLSERVACMDVFRMDRDALHRQIMDMLSDASLRQLEAFHDVYGNERIVYHLLSAAAPLPFRMTPSIVSSLQRLAGADKVALERITQFQREKQRDYYLDKYKTPVLILITLAICYLMYRWSLT
jgi:curved DNA-binding protein CbpA